MKYLAVLFFSLVLAGCSALESTTPTLLSKPKPYIDYTGDTNAMLVFEGPTLKPEKTLLGTFPQEINAQIYNKCKKNLLGPQPGFLGLIRLSSDEVIGKRKEVVVEANKPIYVRFGINHQYAQGTWDFALMPEPGSKHIFRYYLDGWNYRVSAKKLEVADGIETEVPVRFISDSVSGEPTAKWGYCSTIENLKKDQ